MKEKPSVYLIQEFATVAGVTVRALHHYDRLGLLKPSARSASGYRLYRIGDLARLEQIVVLKFLGLPLKQIGRLLRRESSLAETLRRQQRVLVEKHRRLGSAIDAIAEAERSLRRSGEPDWDLFTRIVKEIDMQHDPEWTKKYYSPAAQQRIDARKKLWTPELQAEVSLKWSELLTDVESAVAGGESPAGARAQALAARWRTLVGQFTGGDPEVQKGLNKMWTDQANWPSLQRQSYAIRPEIQDFIVKAMKRM